MALACFPPNGGEAREDHKLSCAYINFFLLIELIYTHGHTGRWSTCPTGPCVPRPKRKKKTKKNEKKIKKRKKRKKNKKKKKNTFSALETRFSPLQRGNSVLTPKVSLVGWPTDFAPKWAQNRPSGHVKLV